ncbi:MAG TPA: glycogen debranching enzyme N-terminal domain-containing protein, partial [Tepidisphaeraceae bacterium]|nr:glycogen debranching enzyme N-terminal domain-containing protein [Tepidisphaeraceae bacterium]
MAGPIDLAGVELPELIEHEWLVSNGLGGYASGTVCGLNTRKYHGLLVAAMSPPVRRMVLLSRVEETLFVRGQRHALSCAEYPGTINPCGHTLLQKFSADPHPRWAWQGDGWTLIRWLRLMPGRNAAVLSYCLLGCEQSAELAIRPMLALRSIHELSYQWNGKLRASRMGKTRTWRVSATCRTPEVFLSADTDFDVQPMWYLSHIYRREIERGYPGLEDLWTPGQFAWTLRPGQFVHFVCATDPISVPEALGEIETREPFARNASIDSMERSVDVLRRSLA